MNIDFNRKQEIIALARERRAEIEDFISPDARPQHKEFIPGLEFPLDQFLDFCKALAVIASGVGGVRSLVNSAIDLFKWSAAGLRKASAPKEPEESRLKERILVIVFEAHVNRREGVSLEYLARVTGSEMKEVAAALDSLISFNVMRQARNGLWRYVVQGG